jgi:NAD(P)-dependent dehydrogenase (short-subunit alcohol dehydrogenase family)
MRERYLEDFAVVGVGAEQGLGAALCRRFAAQGYHVFVAGRTSERLDQVTHTIVGAGRSAEAIESAVKGTAL